ncbi:3'(2'),5'-bisphosphate nucleotidase CysQ [Rubrimonas cliftonensis]|uniref:3'(2'),5'-bisphosphate nucleotidase CysQ n=1 Tax=Rubrimonas cliftonensis TaxID=89524 RepID=A0A1H4CUX0_9RHOB|nr:3'(2'),5'-bisphosphate nucleotidase CysQ [Rubrimonas cliftonensis]SEA64099.1 3'(2'),5'-bisphosphate nucleotidase [Rubrimonas cliftonensis]
MRDAAMAAVLRRLAVAAGAEILRVRAGARLETREKDDRSPVTAADLAADRVIRAGLAEAYPDIPVVSEESDEARDIAGDRPFFLVDPLDGTREFLKGSDQFTVNIALIEGGAPAAGVVAAPAAARLYATAPGGGAVAETGAVDPDAPGDVRPIASKVADPTALRAVASASHRDAETDAWLARHPVARTVAAGSSLKFCLIAAGEADVYPRFGPTMQWDTAAGHAVLAAAGGATLRLDRAGAPLRYGRGAGADADWLNPGFVASAAGFVVGTDREA